MATILIFDDKPVNRQFLVTLLGYRKHRLLEDEWLAVTLTAEDTGKISPQRTQRSQRQRREKRE